MCVCQYFDKPLVKRANVGGDPFAKMAHGHEILISLRRSSIATTFGDSRDRIAPLQVQETNSHGLRQSETGRPVQVSAAGEDTEPVLSRGVPTLPTCSQENWV